MISLRIEKGIPIPPTTVKSGGNIQLLKDMNPGDSVFFDPSIMKKATRFYRVAKKLGIRIVIRRDANGMRMWRTEDDPVEREAALKRAVEAKIATQKRSKPAVRSARAVQEKKKKDKKAVKKLNGKEAKRKRDQEYRKRKKAEKQKAVAVATVPDLGRNIE